METAFNPTIKTSSDKNCYFHIPKILCQNGFYRGVGDVERPHPPIDVHSRGTIW